MTPPKASIHHVLVADDHAIARRGIKEVITDTFADTLVHEVSNAEELHTIFHTYTWKLILLDVRMPNSDIIQMISYIRKQTPSVPILILTAVTEVEYAIQTMKAGANGFIQKHRAADDLVAAIAAVERGETYLHSETADEMVNAVIEQRESLVHTKLSDREMEIFVGIASGNTVKELGSILCISDKTVATHLARIRTKTGMQTHVDIARYAFKHGLVD